MIKKYLAAGSIVLLSLISLVQVAHGRPGNVVRSMHGDVQCTEEFPNLKAGHIKLTDKNYKQWKKDNKKLHVLGVSDSSCSQCCHTEKILTQLQEKFDSSTYTGKKGKAVQIGRLDD